MHSRQTGKTTRMLQEIVEHVVSDAPGCRFIRVVARDARYAAQLQERVKNLFAETDLEVTQKQMTLWVREGRGVRSRIEFVSMLDVRRMAETNRPDTNKEFWDHASRRRWW